VFLICGCKRVVLEAAEDADVVDGAGRDTPLHAAAKSNQLETAITLLRKGSDVLQENSVRSRMHKLQ